MIKISIKSIRIIIVAALLLIVSCARQKGEFACKFKDGDGYRRMEAGSEFPAAEDVFWIYRFPVSKKERKIGVVLQKKETVWVDVQKDDCVIAPASGYYYGKMNFPDEGIYRIVIMQKKGLDYNMYDLIEIRFVDFGEEY